MPESTPAGFWVFFGHGSGAGVKFFWRTWSGVIFHFRQQQDSAWPLQKVMRLDCKYGLIVVGWWFSEFEQESDSQIWKNSGVGSGLKILNTKGIGIWKCDSGHIRCRWGLPLLPVNAATRFFDIGFPLYFAMVSKLEGLHLFISLVWNQLRNIFTNNTKQTTSMFLFPFGRAFFTQCFLFTWVNFFAFAPWAFYTHNKQTLWTLWSIVQVYFDWLEYLSKK